MLIGKEAPVSAVRFGENAYHVIERATDKVKTRRKEGRASGGGAPSWRFEVGVLQIAVSSPETGVNLFQDGTAT